ncbi:MAG TPA: site-specific integrase [Polyangiaceae bacterium]
MTFTWHGKQLWELSGPSKRDAEQLDRLRKKQIKDGTFVPGEKAKALNVTQFFEGWISRREKRSVKDEERWVRLHVLPRHWFSSLALAEVRPMHIHRLVKEIQGEKKLTDKSITNIVGVLSVMFKEARIEERVTENPVVLATKMLDRGVSEERETYSGAEIRVLTRHVEIAWPIRVLNALAFYTGMREGEVCGLRWHAVFTDSSPLWALDVRRQYGGKPLKTDRPRTVPVHPELAEILEHWGREGFELYTGRKPLPEDWVVPNVGKWAKVPHHTKSSYYKAFVKSCKAAGVRPRTLHSTRHTFTTLCRRGRADKDVLTKVTHNPKGTIIDRYTHYEFQPLCDAVLCLDLDAHPYVQPMPGNGGKSGAGPAWLGRRSVAELPPSPEASPGSIPGASTTIQHKTSGPRKSRQDWRQGSVASFDVKPSPEQTYDEEDFQGAYGEHTARSNAWKAGQS